MFLPNRHLFNTNIDVSWFTDYNLQINKIIYQVVFNLEELMIGDLYKFIEHIQSISFRPAAASLFTLYFPSIYFSDYFLKNLLTL